MSDLHDKDGLYTSVLSILSAAWQDRFEEPFPEVKEDDNLFDQGMLDSFIMIEVLEHLEEVYGIEVDLSNFDPSKLFTLAGIHAFFQDTLAPRPLTPVSTS